MGPYQHARFIVIPALVFVVLLSLSGCSQISPDAANPSDQPPTDEASGPPSKGINPRDIGDVSDADLQLLEVPIEFNDSRRPSEAERRFALFIDGLSNIPSPASVTISHGSTTNEAIVTVRFTLLETASSEAFLEASRQISLASMGWLFHHPRVHRVVYEYAGAPEHPFGPHLNTMVKHSLDRVQVDNTEWPAWVEDAANRPDRFSSIFDEWVLRDIPVQAITLPDPETGGSPLDVQPDASDVFRVDNAKMHPAEVGLIITLEVENGASGRRWGFIQFEIDGAGGAVYEDTLTVNGLAAGERQAYMVHVPLVPATINGLSWQTLQPVYIPDDSWFLTSSTGG